jgi:hypothetical protein
MTFKRYLAAVTALCVLAAPAAFAATAATSQGQDKTTTTTPEAKSAAVHRAQQRAYRRNVKLALLVARYHHDKIPPTYAKRAQVKPLWVLRRSNARLYREWHVLRVERRAYARAFRMVPRSTLRAIANCESHGNPRAIGGGGRYRGMFQMTFQIWAAVGGHGDPAAASVAQQYYRAALVYHRYGSGQWPVCGH